MRSLVIALALMAAPAFAQGTEPDSASGHSRLSLNAHAGLVVADGRVPAGYAGVTGVYRLGPGTAVTLSVTGGDLGPGRAVFASLGPGVAHTHTLDERSALEALAEVRVTGSQCPSTGALPYRGTSAFGSVSVDRAFGIVGSVEIVPTVGAYAAVGQWAEEARASGDSLGGAFTSAGVLAGAHVRFSALGRTWELPLVVPVEVLGRGASPLPAYGEPSGRGVRYQGVSYRDFQAVLDANPDLLPERL